MNRKVLVTLREVADEDLPLFFENQREPQALAFGLRSRDREAFDAHWAKIRSDPALVIRTVLADGEVAGNIGAFERDGVTQVGYWYGSKWWRRGVATAALQAFLREFSTRPITAFVAAHNIGSVRVLEKCGFQLVSRRAPTPEDPVEELRFRLD